MFSTFLQVAVVFHFFLLSIVSADKSEEKNIHLPYHIKLFYSKGCEHCDGIRFEFLPPLLKEYKDSIHYEERSVEIAENLREIDRYEVIAGIPEERKTWPALIYRGVILEGENDIMNYLPGLLSGKIDPVDMPYLISEVKNNDVKESHKLHGETIIHAAYFYKTSCSECDRMESYLRLLSTEFPGLRISRFNIKDKHSKLINEFLSNRLNVPDEKHLATPSLFVGDHFLVGQSNLQRLTELLSGYEITGVPEIWEGLSKEQLVHAEQSILQRSESWAPLTIAFAGLVDGVNPCAFATIIFFVSYLSFLGRSRWDILITGMGFTLAVFFTYFFVGLGFFSFLERLTDMFQIVTIVIFGGTAILAVIFGGLSLYDFVRVIRGKPSDMVLQLPDFLKMRIHKTIRARTRMKGILIGALIAGFIVSILELACTGQVYLPTISYMLSIEGMRNKAFILLVLYNLLFILPLVFVFAVVFCGVSSRQIARFFQSNIAIVKLLTALLFFGIAALLVFSVFH